MAYNYFISFYNYTLFIFLMVLALIPALISGAVAKVFTGSSRSGFQLVVQFFWRLFLKLSPLIGSITIEGKEYLNSLESAIYVVSHQSSLDFVLMASIIKNHVTISNHPISDLSIFLKIPRLMGIHYMKKLDPSDAIRIFNILDEHSQKGANIFLFPEGTRNFSNTLLPFQKGAFRLAYERHIPIIPVVLHGSGYIVSKGSNIAKSIEPKDITITFLPPQEVQEGEKLRDYIRKIHDMMQEKVTQNFTKERA